MKVKLLTLGILTFMAGVSAASAESYGDITRETMTLTPIANTKVVVQVIPETVSTSMTNNQKLGMINVIPVGNTIARISLSDGADQHYSLNSSGETQMTTADSLDTIKVVTTSEATTKLVKATSKMPGSSGGTAYGGGETYYYQGTAGKPTAIGVYSSGNQVATAVPHSLTVEAATYTP